MASEEQGIPPEKAKELLESVSFELDTDLRLVAQKMELGKAELLTDAIRLPFQDIQKDLERYVLSGGEEERERLKKRMKNYLARLNANPLLPLHFRLKVLDRFERELDLFDGELAAATLNSHKIAIEMVQQAAREHAEYLPTLLHMITGAVELALRLLRLDIERYTPPHVLALRQLFEIARLGIAVAEALEEEHPAEVVAFRRALATHEIIRAVDMFGYARPQQQLIWKELRHHIDHFVPFFVHRGEQPKKPIQGSVMITWYTKLHQRPEVQPQLPERFIADAIVIPLDAGLERIVKAVDRAQKLVRHLVSKERVDLITEEALRATLIGGQALLDGMRHIPRRAPRQQTPGKHVVLIWDAAKAITEARAMAVLEHYEEAPMERMKRDAWMVRDLSASGAGLERLWNKPLPGEVGSLVALSWIPHEGEPTLGYVRWAKEIKPGEWRLGVEFETRAWRLLRAMPAYLHEEAEARRFPILLRKEQDGVYAL
ncbi:MAG: hypothetical protein D6771_03240, partial [Zetaproteobacteria bacterium]